ncbi:hypothetical protein DRE_04404 [Drechslerella stenobrocha 248]|uniref:P-loop containing nucleoside triphosphate hydrolase protein n=1 Tax=Drechslerella stenobrocha 248 TaxID=1043628 RepID=W7HR42_9PEZI|nr:hypothetical protein DRE_04404 [Drechslerella stenobrocha 248]
MGLESRVSEKIEALRDSEDKAAQKLRWNIALGLGLSNISAEGSKWLTFILFAAISYIRHTNGSQVMDVKTLFTSLAILSIVLLKIEWFIQSMPSIVNAFGCFTRIEEFLMTEVELDDALLFQQKRVAQHKRSPPSWSLGPKKDEVEMWNVGHTSTGLPKPILQVVRLSAGWGQEGLPVLKDLSFDIFPGQVTMLIGPVGCGKSTLLQTLIGETTTYRGLATISCRSAIAYCAQTPWLVNKTIRDNIIGVSRFDPTWYQEVVRCCCLVKDLMLYAKGDQTLVGSQGVGLSGGQKQRIALARAVYSRKPILLLDDIFSGLDAATGEYICNRLLGPGGLLRRNNNTVLLATHAVHHLPFADTVIVMSKEGSIKSHGAPETFTSGSTSDDELIMEGLKGEDWYPQDTCDGDKEVIYDAAYEKMCTSKEASTYVDHTPQNQKGPSAFRYYIKSIGWRHTLIFGCLAITQASFWNVLTIWLNDWSNEPDPTKTGFYMTVYTGLVFFFFAAFAIWVWHFHRWVMSVSSINLHTWQLNTMMRSKMAYFNTTDVGVTTNRFSQDLAQVDMDLPTAMHSFIETVLVVIGTVGISLLATPWIAVALPFLGFVFYSVVCFYLQTSRQLRLLDMGAKAPLYSHFQETLSGISTIRAFCWENAFREECGTLLSKSQQPSYYLSTSQRWFAMVLDMIVAILAFAIVLIVVYLRNSLNSGYIGLALLNTMSLSASLKIAILFYTNLEISLGAVTRMCEFNNTATKEDDEDKHHPPALEWPQSGNIVYRNYSASHMPNSDIVLNSINLDIPPGSKVGICGRSGSGKSSTVAGLFRLLEVQSGSISLDGVDISKVPINALRGRLNVLSQEPFFLAGTIRENMSYAHVSGECTELDSKDILEALATVGLKDKVLNLEGGLDAAFDLQGLLSHGERQLFCLARAMLRDSSVIVLDEFTSSVDQESDDVMQKVLREYFWGKTVVTVAHRLNTIVDYDTVIVLDKGNIVEMGNPHQLLRQSGSAFKALYDLHEGPSAAS